MNKSNPVFDLMTQKHEILNYIPLLNQWMCKCFYITKILKKKTKKNSLKIKLTSIKIVYKKVKPHLPISINEKLDFVCKLLFYAPHLSDFIFPLIHVIFVAAFCVLFRKIKLLLIISVKIYYAYVLLAQTFQMYLWTGFFLSLFIFSFYSICAVKRQWRCIATIRII